MKKIWKFFKKLPYLKHNDNWYRVTNSQILLFCGDNNRGETINGKAYSRQLDTIFDYFTNKGFKCTHIAYPYSLLVGSLAWGSPLSYNRYFFKYELFELFLKLCGKYLHIDYKLNSMEQLFNCIILKSKPKCVFTIGPDQILCKVCRENKIPLIEVLHGYGYETIEWNLELRLQEYLPSHIISFDDRSTMTFKELENKGVSIVQTNDIWHDKFNPNDLPTELIKKINESQTKKIILISTSWGYDNEKKSLKEFSGILENGYIPNSLIEIMSETDESIYWCIRLHPRHYRSSHRYPKLYKILEELEYANKNLDWRIASNVPLPYILNIIDGHITMISGTAYEAATYGIKTLFLCPTLKDINKKYFTDIIDNGYAQRGDFRNSAEIIKWINSISRDGKIFNQNPQLHWDEFAKLILNKK